MQCVSSHKVVGLCDSKVAIWPPIPTPLSPIRPNKRFTVNLDGAKGGALALGSGPVAAIWKDGANTLPLELPIPGSRVSAKKAMSPG